MSIGTIHRIAQAGHDGFIRPDGGPADGTQDVHFSIRGHTPPELKIVGTRVEYDSVVRSGKGPHTDNAKVLDPNTSAAASTATSPKAKPDDVAVSWRNDPPTVQMGLILVRTFIKFLRNGSAAIDLKVSLFKVDHEGNRTQVKTPSAKATPTDTGEAYFALYLAADAEHCDLVATAGGKEYPHSWSKNPPVQTGPVQAPGPGTPDPAIAVTAATQATQPPTPKVEKLSYLKGRYSFQVKNAPPSSELCLKVSGFSAELRKLPCTDSDPWVSDKLPIDAGGTLLFEVRVATERARGPVSFVIGTFESERFYLTHTLPPALPKK